MFSYLLKPASRLVVVIGFKRWAAQSNIFPEFLAFFWPTFLIFKKSKKSLMMIYMHAFILWHTDLLLHNDHETNNKTMAIAMQQLCKYSAVQGLLLGSSPRTTMEVLLGAVFYMWSAPKLYFSTNRVQRTGLSVQAPSSTNNDTLKVATVVQQDHQRAE
jgi:hypothetical protein